MTPWEKDVIAFFERVSDLLGIRKSVGAIYGALFASEAPLSLIDIQQTLGISKGSAVQGINLLKRLGAVKVVLVEDMRREFFTVEVKLKRIVSGFLNEELEPHLEAGKTSLEKLEQITDEQNDFQQSRTKLLQSWQKQAGRILPLVKTVFR